jgi:hypothetical protein
MIVSLDYYFYRFLLCFYIYCYFLDVFFQLLREVCNTIRELYKNKTSEYFNNAFAVLLKQYL